jgi:hypothetical protein
MIWDSFCHASAACCVRPSVKRYGFARRHRNADDIFRALDVELRLSTTFGRSCDDVYSTSSSPTYDIRLDGADLIPWELNRLPCIHRSLSRSTHGCILRRQTSPRTAVRQTAQLPRNQNLFMTIDVFYRSNCGDCGLLQQQTQISWERDAVEKLLTSNYSYDDTSWGRIMYYVYYVAVGDKIFAQSAFCWSVASSRVTNLENWLTAATITELLISMSQCYFHTRQTNDNKFHMRMNDGVRIGCVVCRSG